MNSCEIYISVDYTYKGTNTFILLVVFPISMLILKCFYCNINALWFYLVMGVIFTNFQSLVKQFLAITWTLETIMYQTIIPITHPLMSYLM